MLNSRLMMLMVLGALAAPAAFGQKKEDIQALQRDVALVQADVAAMKRSLEEKLDAMTALMQQNIDATAKTNAAMAAMEQRVATQLADQQKATAAPVAEVGAKVAALTDELTFIRESVSSIDGRLSKMNAQMADLSNAVRVLQAPPPPPPDAAGTAPSAAQKTGPPPGISADQLYSDARRDMQGAKNDIALQEFSDYLKWFPDTDYAVNSQFYIGNIQYSKADYDGALKSFDTVLTKYPENSNKNADAMYMKGKTLVQLGDDKGAADQYRAFLKKYPHHELTPKVQAELRAVAAPATQVRKRAR